MRLLSRQTLLVAWLAMAGATARADAPDARTSDWELEVGVLRTVNMELRGYDQKNATEGWGSTDPTLRIEHWWNKPAGWNYGVVLQPIYVTYHETITNALTAKGQVFVPGQKATLNYQFHSLRFSANYPLLTSAGGSYLRMGGSVVARYAGVNLRAAGSTIDDSDVLVAPLINLESQVALTPRHSIFVRADFLPAIDGNVLLDGIYDVLVAFRTLHRQSQTIDVGVRLFFGGYDPNQPNDYANRIFFAGAVLRYSF